MNTTSAATREERAVILGMLAEGKVSADEAADLLDALDAPEAGPVGAERPDPAAMPNPPDRWQLGRSRCLVIQVAEGEDSKVNLRIPLALARAAGRFIPRQAQGYLSKYDIELGQLIESADSSEGSMMLMDIHDGDGRVRIFVE